MTPESTALNLKIQSTCDTQGTVAADRMLAQHRRAMHMRTTCQKYMYSSVRLRPVGVREHADSCVMCVHMLKAVHADRCVICVHMLEAVDVDIQLCIYSLPIAGQVSAPTSTCRLTRRARDWVSAVVLS